MGLTISGAQWLNLAINVILPAVVALVTARVAHSGLKALILLVLSAISGFLVSWLDAVNNEIMFDWSQAGFTVLSGFVVAVAAHYGLLKPADITGSEGLIQMKVKGGLGDWPGNVGEHDDEDDEPYGRHSLR